MDVTKKNEKWKKSSDTLRTSHKGHEASAHPDGCEFLLSKSLSKHEKSDLFAGMDVRVPLKINAIQKKISAPHASLGSVFSFKPNLLVSFFSLLSSSVS